MANIVRVLRGVLRLTRVHLTLVCVVDLSLHLDDVFHLDFKLGKHFVLYLCFLDCKSLLGHVLSFPHKVCHPCHIIDLGHTGTPQRHFRILLHVNCRRELAVLLCRAHLFVRDHLSAADKQLLRDAQVLAGFDSEFQMAVNPDLLEHKDRLLILGPLLVFKQLSAGLPLLLQTQLAGPAAEVNDHFLQLKYVSFVEEAVFRLLNGVAHLLVYMFAHQLSEILTARGRNLFVFRLAVVPDSVERCRDDQDFN